MSIKRYRTKYGGTSAGPLSIMVMTLLMMILFSCNRSDREKIELRVEIEELSQQLEQMTKAKVTSLNELFNLATGVVKFKVVLVYLFRNCIANHRLFHFDE